MSKVSIRPEQIESWVARYFDYKSRKGGKEILICNPFVYDEGYHLNISTEKAAVHDWRGDGWVGIDPRTGKRRKCTFLRFVQLFLERRNGKCSFRDAARDVLGSSSLAFLPRRPRDLESDQKAKGDGSLELPEGTEAFDLDQPSKLERALLRWLESRGVDHRKIRKYDVRYNGLDVVWPYFEYDELVYWQSRSRTDKRFLFPDESVGATKGEFLYGYDLVEPSSYVIVVEAIFCCQTLEEQTVASGGASLTDTQTKKLRVFLPRDGVILAPDNDVPGLESAIANCSKLRRYGIEVYVSIPPRVSYPGGVTTDWNDLVRYTDLDPKEELRKRAEKYSPMLSLKLRKEMDLLRSTRA